MAVKDNKKQSREQSLAALLADEKLLSLPEVADKLGLRITRVHDLLSAKRIIAVELDSRRYVPAAFFNDKDAISKHVAGIITVLSDGGYSNDEIFQHLFTVDETLPGRPIDALHGHLAREAIRRAQALAL